MYYRPDVITKSYDKCPRIHVRDSTNINYMNFRPDLSLGSGCESNSDFNANQKNGIDANCLTDALITNISGLLSEKKSNIRNKFMSKCMYGNPTHVASITDVIVPICNARIIQGATDMSACMINSMQLYMIDNATRTHNSYSIQSLFFGLFVFFAMVILIRIIIKYQ